MLLGMEVQVLARWGPNSPSQKKAHSSPPLFGPCLLWPNGRPSQQLLSSCAKWIHTALFDHATYCSHQKLAKTLRHLGRDSSALGARQFGTQVRTVFRTLRHQCRSVRTVRTHETSAEVSRVRSVRNSLGIRHVTTALQSKEYQNTKITDPVHYRRCYFPSLWAENSVSLPLLSVLVDR